MTTSLNPKIIPLFKKKRFLKSLLEDDFRDQIVRPLFQEMGLRHGKDICGVDEEGKDCYFFGDDPIRGTVLYVVQTKKGDLKLSSKARDNLLNAEAQLRTALATPVKSSVTKQSYRPDYVILAASGEINKSAEEHITDEIKDTRLVFYDSDRLIPLIDVSERPNLGHL
jgi:hypothetical protein